jgi:hypothetical protein
VSAQIGGLQANKRTRLPFKSPMLTGTPNKAASTPIHATPKGTPLSKFRQPNSTFKSPSMLPAGSPRSTLESTVALMQQIRTLESRLVVLKNAQKIKQANEDDGPFSDRRLEELSHKWLIAGRAAAEAVFALSAAPEDQPARAGGAVKSWGFDNTVEDDQWQQDQPNEEEDVADPPRRPHKEGPGLLDAGGTSVIGGKEGSRTMNDFDWAGGQASEAAEPEQVKWTVRLLDRMAYAS